MRTADAIGIHRVHAVWPKSWIPQAQGHRPRQPELVDVKLHPDIGSAVAELKASGMQILATHLSDSSVDFRAIDYTRPTAILVGQEKHGIGEEALALGRSPYRHPHGRHGAVPQRLGGRRRHPLRGPAPANWPAVIARLSTQPGRAEHHLVRGGYPVYAQLCKEKEMPYPSSVRPAKILADERWWQQMQLTRKAMGRPTPDDPSEE